MQEVQQQVKEEKTMAELLDHAHQNSIWSNSIKEDKIPTLLSTVYNPNNPNANSTVSSSPVPPTILYGKSTYDNEMMYLQNVFSQDSFTSMDLSQSTTPQCSTSLLPNNIKEKNKPQFSIKEEIVEDDGGMISDATTTRSDKSPSPTISRGAVPNNLHQFSTLAANQQPTLPLFPNNSHDLDSEMKNKKSNKLHESIKKMITHKPNVASDLTSAQPFGHHLHPVKATLLTFVSASGKVKMICEVEECTKVAQSRKRCKRHGGGPRCRFPNCTKSSQGKGRCRTHGGGKQCQIEGCFSGAQQRGYCSRHGGAKLCSNDICDRHSRGNGLCAHHGGGKRCSVQHCPRSSRIQGMCALHRREISGFSTSTNSMNHQANNSLFHHEDDDESNGLIDVFDDLIKEEQRKTQDNITEDIIQVLPSLLNQQHTGQHTQENCVQQNNTILNASANCLTSAAVHPLHFDAKHNPNSFSLSSTNVMLFDDIDMKQTKCI